MMKTSISMISLQAAAVVAGSASILCGFMDYNTGAYQPAGCDFLYGAISAGTDISGFGSHILEAVDGIRKAARTTLRKGGTE
jgi:hypothetical protein